MGRVGTESEVRVWSEFLTAATDRKAAHAEYLASDEWEAKRQVALERAGSRCQVCNGTSRLDVHHRTYERWGAEEAGDLTVLCRRCHSLFHEKHKRKRKNGRSKKSKLQLPLEPCAGCRKHKTRGGRLCKPCRKRGTKAPVVTQADVDRLANALSGKFKPGRTR